MQTMFNFKPGDRLRVRCHTGLSTDVGGEEKKTRLEEVQVIKQYPHHLLVENRWGTRWSITNTELFQAWYRKRYGDTGAGGPKFSASGKVV